MVELEQLFIAEFDSHSHLCKAFELLKNTIQIHTCQRSLVLSTHPLATLGSRRSFSGVEAYEFFLRFACGLESEIKGETDVFGQIKTAFKNYLELYPQQSSEWSPLFSKIFEDTKDIRTQYLQGLGGNTYGALSRRLLNPCSQDQVLILGAGQISKSVAPYFSEFNLKIWNRSPERLFQLRLELSQKGHREVECFTDTEKLIESLQAATLIILATPPQSETDALILKSHQLNPEQVVLHLGGQTQDLAHFQEHTHFYSLSDLFLMEKEQSETRTKQVQYALHACHRRALLRSLSASIHIAHGWEDLALFN